MNRFIQSKFLPDKNYFSRAKIEMIGATLYSDIPIGQEESDKINNLIYSLFNCAQIALGREENELI